MPSPGHPVPELAIPSHAFLLQIGPPVVHRPIVMNAFEFAVVAGLRAAQLSRGCTPRVPPAEKVTVTAQLEVAAGKIVSSWTLEPTPGD